MGTFNEGRRMRVHLLLSCFRVDFKDFVYPRRQYLDPCFGSGLPYRSPLERLHGMLVSLCVVQVCEVVLYPSCQLGFAQVRVTIDVDTKNVEEQIRW